MKQPNSSKWDRQYSYSDFQIRTECIDLINRALSQTLQQWWDSLPANQKRQFFPTIEVDLRNELTNIIETLQRINEDNSKVEAYIDDWNDYVVVFRSFDDEQRAMQIAKTTYDAHRENLLRYLSEGNLELALFAATLLLNQKRFGQPLTVLNI